MTSAQMRRHTTARTNAASTGEEPQEGKHTAVRPVPFTAVTTSPTPPRELHRRDSGLASTTALPDGGDSSVSLSDVAAGSVGGGWRAFDVCRRLWSVVS